MTAGQIAEWGSGAPAGHGDDLAAEARQSNARSIERVGAQRTTLSQIGQPARRQLSSDGAQCGTQALLQCRMIRRACGSRSWTVRSLADRQSEKVADMLGRGAAANLGAEQPALRPTCRPEPQQSRFSCIVRARP